MESMIVGQMRQLVRTYEHLADILELKSELDTTLTGKEVNSIPSYRQWVLEKVRTCIKTAMELAQMAEDIPWPRTFPGSHPPARSWRPCHDPTTLCGRATTTATARSVSPVREATTRGSGFGIGWIIPLPTTSFMPDRGLWTVCRASRDSMKRVYGKTKALVTTCHHCAPNDPFEQHYRRLADFIEQGRQFPFAVHVKKFNVTYAMLRFHLKQQSYLIRHLYLLQESDDDGWKFGSCRIPFASFFQVDWEILPKTPVCEYGLGMIDEGNHDKAR